MGAGASELGRLRAFPAIGLSDAHRGIWVSAKETRRDIRCSVVLIRLSHVRPLMRGINLDGDDVMAWTDEDDVMAWTFESALENAVITIVARDDARGSYAIRVGVLRTPVVIELRESPTIGGQFEFRTSHAI